MDLVILTTGLLEHFLEALELIEWDMLSQSSEIAGEIHCLAALLLLLLVEAAWAGASKDIRVDLADDLCISLAFDWSTTMKLYLAPSIVLDNLIVWVLHHLDKNEGDLALLVLKSCIHSLGIQPLPNWSLSSSVALNEASNPDILRHHVLELHHFAPDSLVGRIDFYFEILLVIQELFEHLRLLDWVYGIIILFLKVFSRIFSFWFTL